MSEQQRSQLKQLIARGEEQRYLTYAEVNDHLPDDIVDPEQIEDIIGMINDMGIEVHEFAPDSDTLLLNESSVNTDDDVAEETAAALAAVDSEFGRTTDPVRMYMREMGTVELLKFNICFLPTHPILILFRIPGLNVPAATRLLTGGLSNHLDHLHWSLA